MRRRWGVPTPTLRGRIGRLKRRVAEPTLHRVYARFTPASYAAFLRQLAAQRSTMNGVFSFKAMWGNWSDSLLRIGLSEADIPGEVKWIRTHRHDRVRQAISNVRAHQTHSWHSYEPAARPPTYDRQALEAALTGLGVHYSSWDAYLAERDATALDVWYEDLVEDYDAVMRSVLDWVGVRAAIPAPQLSRQADEINDEWYERFTSGR
jgi:LPS sulfotransferase NodH